MTPTSNKPREILMEEIKTVGITQEEEGRWVKQRFCLYKEHLTADACQYVFQWKLYAMAAGPDDCYELQSIEGALTPEELKIVLESCLGKVFGSITGDVLHMVGAQDRLLAYLHESADLIKALSKGGNSDLHAFVNECMKGSDLHLALLQSMAMVSHVGLLEKFGK